MKSFHRLKGFLWKHKWSYIFGFLWLIVVDSFQLLVPKILGSVTDELQRNTLNIYGLFKYSIYIVLTGLIIGLGRYFWRIYIIGNSRKLEYYLRKEFFNHILTLSPNYFNAHKTGDLMSHATNDINAVRMALGFGTIMMVDSFFVIILTLLSMIRTTNVKLTALVVLNIPIIVFITRKFGNTIYYKSKDVQESLSTLTEISQESFAGIRVIKSFVQEDLVKDNFYRANDDNLKKNLELAKVSGSFRPLLQFVFSISLFVSILYVGKEVIMDNITLGDFISFNSYLALLNWPTRAIGQVINVLQRGSASMDRLNLILDEEAEILDNPLVDSPDSLNGSIQFKNVTFRYPNANYDALTDINFNLEPGKTLAIIGRTGSGKTTILNLLLRLYNLEHGNILIDDIDINNYSLQTLRENIGYVPQNSFLFSKSIKDNIGFAFDTDLPIEDIHHAAKMAEVYDNIMEFPNGFDTVLGERGVTLSGGQRQRTSIARALIKKSPILILDDSLSAVDTETEEKILSSLKLDAKNATKIIISHRISTIKTADEIIFLEDGKIVQRGKHDELLALDGHYKNLYKKQLLEEKIKA